MDQGIRPQKFLFPDRLLVQRVKQYLEQVSKSYVDVGEMSDFLQRAYHDYGRRKRKQFRSQVQGAYEALVAECNGGVNEESSDDDDSDDVVLSDACSNSGTTSTGNHLNQSLLGMYKAPITTDPINISSDDDEDEAPAKKKDDKKTSTPKGNQMRKRKPTGKPSLLNGNVGKKRRLNERDESRLTFKDVGGFDGILEEVCKLLLPLKQPEIYRKIGISAPRGFLLHGPPGCGKTLLANAIAGELNVPLLKLAATELITGISGESEARIRELFSNAKKMAPCLIFIDEIDAITPNRNNAQKEMERRVVSQMLTCLDDLNRDEDADQIMIIGATNRPDALDPALRRAGRFDKEITIGIPDAKAREAILRVHCKCLKLQAGFDYANLATYTPGFVGADLAALVSDAAMVAINELLQECKSTTKKPDTDDVIVVSDKDKTIEANKDDEKTIETEKATAETDTKKIEENGAETESETKITSTADETHASDEPSTSAVISDEPQVKTTRLQELLELLSDDFELPHERLNDVAVKFEHFQEALKHIQPSAKREGFITVPDTTWDDIGSLKDVREELTMSILAPIHHSTLYESLGLSNPTGILLCGPPGCGKTLLAKAVANEAGINFISVKGPELLNMYVGESEKAVRQCFQRARNSAPCVIFFDELDALCPKRSGETNYASRVVNQLLTEMDGIQSRRGVFLMAATNRPDIIDAAVLRPGRLDKILYVGLPSPTDRVDILKAITKNGTRPSLSPDVNLSVIGRSDQCNGYTGADLAALVREASIEALKEHLLNKKLEEATDDSADDQISVHVHHFLKAVSSIRPSVSEKDRKYYEQMKKQYSTPAGANIERMNDEDIDNLLDDNDACDDVPMSELT